MTNIISVNGPEAIWLLADRRLTRAGKIDKEDARKLMILETTDGIALLGYTGLGRTALGTEPADWMSAVLRGHNMPLGPSLWVLAKALEAQFPRHLKQHHHGIIIPAFLNNEPKYYSLKFEFDPSSKKYRLRLEDMVIPNVCPGKVLISRLGAAGTGGYYLNETSKDWARDLLRLLNAHDRGRIGPWAIADELAKRNYDAYKALKDPKDPKYLSMKDTVGPDCIVVWRYRKNTTLRPGFAGGQQNYTGTTRSTVGASIPEISCGSNTGALIHALAARAAYDFARQPVPESVRALMSRVNLPPDKRLR
jgi:hypothetical protein